jgi:hypothetical protein
MPILPIDLQILFSQMNQVGKDQAIQKEGNLIQQSLQGTEMVKVTEQKDNSVNQSQEIGTGIEKLKNEEKKKQEKRRKEKDEKSKQEVPKKNVYEDPALGKNIDIMG